MSGYLKEAEAEFFSARDAFKAVKAGPLNDPLYPTKVHDAEDKMTQAYAKLKRAREAGVSPNDIIQKLQDNVLNHEDPNVREISRNALLAIGQNLQDSLSPEMKYALSLASELFFFRIKKRAGAIDKESYRDQLLMVLQEYLTEMLEKLAKEGFKSNPMTEVNLISCFFETNPKAKEAFDRIKP